MWDTAKVLDLISGRYEGGWGILVLTDKRLISVGKGFFKLKDEDFSLDKISSIQYKTGLMFGEITIFKSGDKVKIEMTNKKRTRIFAEKIRSLI